MTKETVLFFFFAVNIHGLLPSFQCLFLRGGEGGLILLGQFVSPLPPPSCLQRIFRLLIKQLGVSDCKLKHFEWTVWLCH